MKIHGSTTAKNLLLITLAVTSVSSIALLTKKLVESTSVESISGQNESLEIVLGGEELRLKVTGRNTTEVVQILKGMYCNMGGSPFSGRFLRYTPQQESVTLRKQDSCF